MFTTETILALLSLTALEVVLGIDNIVFIAIIVGKLSEEQREKARRIGLLLAMVMRIVLLLFLSWIIGLKATLFSVLDHPFSGRDLILLLGGLFLIAKATYEIHHKMEEPSSEQSVKKASSFASALVQIIIIDMVFSLDSVITAVGMAQDLWVMIVAVVIAVLIMLIFAKSVSEFIEKHPTLKMLALSFLLLVGVMLVADGLGQHIDRNYIYFAMGFSLLVEFLNIKTTRKSS